MGNNNDTFVLFYVHEPMGNINDTFVLFYVADENSEIPMNFPRDQLKLLKEFGTGDFGKVHIYICRPYSFPSFCFRHNEATLDGVSILL